MEKQELTLLLGGFAAIVAVLMSSGRFSFWDSIVGITLLGIFIFGWPYSNLPKLMQWTASSLISIAVIMIIGVGVDIWLAERYHGDIFFKRYGMWLDCYREVQFVHSIERRDLFFFSLWISLVAANRLLVFINFKLPSNYTSCRFVNAVFKK